ncbi:hypothetical protein [Dickeya dadantii]|uniref:hypothetical protein n=1 Tax=Dickeya dadantii TaxID=204038 RepID=UPI00137319FB|nr:hypothetical protein [Dickeya dadantii]NPE65227.1 hypothetical protein [Dickeya dadantii]
MKYVKEVVFILSIPISILFSGMAEAAEMYPNYPNETLLYNSSDYCVSIYRDDGQAFSDGKKNIYIGVARSGLIPKNHPIYVKVDFYESDVKDKHDSNSCHGKFHEKRRHLFSVNYRFGSIER